MILDSFFVTRSKFSWLNTRIFIKWEMWYVVIKIRRSIFIKFVWCNFWFVLLVVVNKVLIVMRLNIEIFVRHRYRRHWRRKLRSIHIISILIFVQCIWLKTTFFFKIFFYIWYFLFFQIKVKLFSTVEIKRAVDLGFIILRLLQ